MKRKEQLKELGEKEEEKAQEQLRNYLGMNEIEATE